jgi:hypothetical protein
VKVPDALVKLMVGMRGVPLQPYDDEDDKADGKPCHDTEQKRVRGPVHGVPFRNFSARVCR